VSAGDRVRAFVERVRASAWAGVAARAVLIVLGLTVLAWLGRGTVAAPAMASTLSDAGVEGVGDAGASVAPARVVPSSVAPPVATVAAGASPAGHARATPEDPVYLNAAGVEDLRRLPGVGPKRAEAIVALRQRIGRFQRVEELLRVKGIGRTTVRKWRPLVRLDTPPSPDAGPH
jgi:competence protein ComEA